MRCFQFLPLTAVVLIAALVISFAGCSDSSPDTPVTTSGQNPPEEICGLSGQPLAEPAPESESALGTGPDVVTQPTLDPKPQTPPHDEPKPDPSSQTDLQKRSALGDVAKAHQLLPMLPRPIQERYAPLLGTVEQPALMMSDDAIRIVKELRGELKAICSGLPEVKGTTYSRPPTRSDVHRRKLIDPVTREQGGSTMVSFPGATDPFYVAVGAQVPVDQAAMVRFRFQTDHYKGVDEDTVAVAIRADGEDPLRFNFTPRNLPDDIATHNLYILRKGNQVYYYYENVNFGARYTRKWFDQPLQFVFRIPYRSELVVEELRIGRPQ